MKIPVLRIKRISRIKNKRKRARIKDRRINVAKGAKKR
jgi:hypothetical protein